MSTPIRSTAHPSLLHSARRWPPLPTAGERAAVASTLTSQVYTDGPATRRLERALAERVGALAVAFSSCTAALHAILSAFAPERIYAPAWTFIGSLTGALHLGIPITFLDVDPDRHVLAGLPAGPGLVLAVDLHGVPHGLPRSMVVTDACQSFGSELDAGAGTHAWSFSATKAIPSFSGGAVTTPDDNLARELRALRNYGIHSGARATAAPGWSAAGLGHHWRITEPDAALAAERIGSYGAWLERMSSTGDQLRSAAVAAGLEVQAPQEASRATWHKVRVRRPGTPSERLQGALDALGIPSHRWGVALHRTLGSGESLPVTEQLADESICLSTETVPFWTWSDAELEDVCENIDCVRGLL